MIFTQAQINDMLSILTRYQLTFILNQLGPTYLTAAEKALLLAAGIDVNKYVNKKGVIEHAFYFGILADAIGDERAKKMDYPQFQKFIASKNFIPLITILIFIEWTMSKDLKPLTQVCGCCC